MTAQDAGAIEAIFRDHLIGRAIRALQVVGVNSLKTVTPGPEAVSGADISAVRVELPAIEIAAGAFNLHVHLARTGRVTWLEQAGEWSASERTPPPTIRLLIDAGGALDFREPAKTKRITVSILDAP